MSVMAAPDTPDIDAVTRIIQEVAHDAELAARLRGWVTAELAEDSGKADVQR